MTADTHEAKAPRSFEERLQRLCGESTYRMPVEGVGSHSGPPPIPAAHQFAMALSFARDGKDDFGPDVAYDIVTQRTGHGVRVTHRLAEAMGNDRGPVIRRNRPNLRVAAWAGYTWAVHGGPFPNALRPSETSQDDWLVLVEAARRILWIMADEAIYRAERAYFRKTGRRAA